MAEYIEREAAIAAAFSATSLGNSAFRDVYDTVNRLRLIPAADVQPVRHGRWTEKQVPDEEFFCGYHIELRCSCCDEEGLYMSPYCPNCGAKMDGGET